MYQYSRAIYRSIKDLIDPVRRPGDATLEFRRDVLNECESRRWNGSRPTWALLHGARACAFRTSASYFPITAQDKSRAVQEGAAAAVAFIEEQIESGALDGGVSRCRARRAKAAPAHACRSEYCPSHQHLESRTKVAA